MRPIVGEVENEIRKEAASLKEKAELAADGEVEGLKQRAGDLIGKLRSIF